MTLICEKKISAEVRLIHAEQISLYKFHRFEKKAIDAAEDWTSQAGLVKSISIYGFSWNVNAARVYRPSFRFLWSCFKLRFR